MFTHSFPKIGSEFPQLGLRLYPTGAPSTTSLGRPLYSASPYAFAFIAGDLGFSLKALTVAGSESLLRLCAVCAFQLPHAARASRVGGCLQRHVWKQGDREEKMRNCSLCMTAEGVLPYVSSGHAAKGVKLGGVFFRETQQLQTQRKEKEKKCWLTEI